MTSLPNKIRILKRFHRDLLMALKLSAGGGELPSPANALVVQRWIDLTFAHTSFRIPEGMRLVGLTDFLQVIWEKLVSFNRMNNFSVCHNKTDEGEFYSLWNLPKRARLSLPTRTVASLPGLDTRSFRVNQGQPASDWSPWKACIPRRQACISKRAVFGTPHERNIRRFRFGIVKRNYGLVDDPNMRQGTDQTICILTNF
jgi:hypothetical protein